MHQKYLFIVLFALCEFLLFGGGNFFLWSLCQWIVLDKKTLKFSVMMNLTLLNIYAALLLVAAVAYEHTDLFRVILGPYAKHIYPPPLFIREIVAFSAFCFLAGVTFHNVLAKWGNNLLSEREAQKVPPPASIMEPAGGVQQEGVRVDEEVAKGDVEELQGPRQEPLAVAVVKPEEEESTPGAERSSARKSPRLRTNVAESNRSEVGSVKSRETEGGGGGRSPVESMTAYSSRSLAGEQIQVVTKMALEHCNLCGCDTAIEEVVGGRDRSESTVKEEATSEPEQIMEGVKARPQLAHFIVPEESIPKPHAYLEGEDERELIRIQRNMGPAATLFRQLKEHHQQQQRQRQSGGDNLPREERFPSSKPMTKLVAAKAGMVGKNQKPATFFEICEEPGSRHSHIKLVSLGEEEKASEGRMSRRQKCNHKRSLEQGEGEKNPATTSTINIEIKRPAGARLKARKATSKHASKPTTRSPPMARKRQKGSTSKKKQKQKRKQANSV